MKCPACYGNTTVRDSRPANEGKNIRRRRECLSCGKRYTTFEVRVDPDTGRLALEWMSGAESIPTESRARLQMIIDLCQSLVGRIR